MKKNPKTNPKHQPCMVVGQAGRDEQPRLGCGDTGQEGQRCSRRAGGRILPPLPTPGVAAREWKKVKILTIFRVKRFKAGFGVGWWCLGGKRGCAGLCAGHPPGRGVQSVSLPVPLLSPSPSCPRPPPADLTKAAKPPQAAPSLSCGHRGEGGMSLKYIFFNGTWEFC